MRWRRTFLISEQEFDVLASTPAPTLLTILPQGALIVQLPRGSLHNFGTAPDRRARCGASSSSVSTTTVGSLARRLTRSSSELPRILISNP